MANSTDKLYYRIGDVADMLELPQSTLRFWETKFSIAVPKRNAGRTRLYTPKDIDNLRMIKFLVHDKGLRIEAAREEIKRNRDGVLRHAEAIEDLKNVRARLITLLDSLHKLR
ncbi:MAG: MerR family transcriptional regulator [Duncaniella sp.]|nr:MerR family transcriptional regulator [Duncaniella sp.]